MKSTRLLTHGLVLSIFFCAVGCGSADAADDGDENAAASTLGPASFGSWTQDVDAMVKTIQSTANFSQTQACDPTSRVPLPDNPNEGHTDSTSSRAGNIGGKLRYLQFSSHPSAPGGGFSSTELYYDEETRVRLVVADEYMIDTSGHSRRQLLYISPTGEQQGFTATDAGSGTVSPGDRVAWSPRVPAAVSDDVINIFKAASQAITTMQSCVVATAR